MKKRTKKNIIYVIILLAVISLSVGFSAFQKQLFVNNIKMNVRIEENVRVSNFMVEKTSGNAVSNSEDFNKEKIYANVTFPSTSSYVLYKVDLTNFGNIKSGLLDITNNSSGTNFQICDSNGSNCTNNIETPVCSGNNCTLGSTKEIYVKVTSTSSGTKNIDLDLDFEPYNNVTYSFFQENTSSFKSEIMSNDTYEVTLTSDVEEVDVSGSASVTYNKNNHKLTISNVGSDITISAKYKATTIAETYTGSNPNNYVRFNNTLYRIIGSFNTDDGYSNVEERVKIVSNISIGNNIFDTTSNDFATSSIKDILNTTYYGDLSDIAKNLIDTALWNNNSIEYIGLISGSDYTNNSSWLTSVGYTLTQSSNNKVKAVTSNGLVDVDVTSNQNTKPVVYLKTDVLIVGGDGTSTNPYILESSSGGLQSNPTIITGINTNVTGSYMDLLTVTNKVGTPYYSTSSILNSENYSSSGSTTIPRDRSVDVYTVYYYIPAGSNYKAKAGRVTSRINGLIHSVAYTKGANIDSIGANSDSCTTSGYSLSCSVTLPTITPSNGYENGKWSDGTNQYNPGASYTLTNSEKTLTSSVTGKTYTATIYYYDSTIKTTTKSCTVTSGSSCTITLPSSVQNSSGLYNTTFKGVASSTGSMQNSSLALTNDINLYSIYSSNVTNYYYNEGVYTTRTIYRNVFFKNTSELNTILSLSNDGIYNYETHTGVGSSSWIGLSTANDTTAEYNNVSEAATSTSNTLYTIYQYSISYQKGSNVSSITSTGDACKITSSNTCSVVLPGITPNSGYEIVGWSETNGDTTGILPNQSYTINQNNKVLYANAVGSTYTATFYYYDGSAINTTTSSCTVSNQLGNCTVSVPAVVQASTGVYNSTYKGVSVSTSDMNSSSLAINNNTSKFYANYSSSVTRYYYSSGYKSNTIYRNEYFVGDSQMVSVLSTVDNGTTNYTSSRGPGSSTWKGLSTAQDITPEYNTVALAAASTNTTFYTVYEFTLNFAKGQNISEIGANSLTCNVTTSDTSCGVMLPSITPMDGYASVGWGNNNGSTTGESPLSIHMVNSNNTTLYANAYIICNYQNTSTETCYAKLNNAFSEVANNQTIKVLNNTTETTTATLSSNKTGIKLDLNGKTITTTAETGIQNNGTLDIYNTSSTTGIIESSQGNIIINNGTLTTNLTSSANNITIRSNSGFGHAITTETNASTVINTKTLITSTTSSTITGDLIRTLIDVKGTFTLSGGTLTSNYDETGVIYMLTNTSRFIMTSGTIEGYIGIYNNNSTAQTPAAIDISGGSITTTGRGISNNASGKINITGGTFNSSSSIIDNASSGIVSITGANITATGTTYSAVYNSGSGSIILSNTTINSYDNCVLNVGSGTVNIISGTYTATGTTKPTIYSRGTSTTNITGGTFNGVSAAVYSNESATINISGGTLTSTNQVGLYNNSDRLFTVSGGSIESTTLGGIYNYGTMAVTGGTIRGLTYGVVSFANSTITIGTNDANVSTTSPLIEATGTTDAYGMNAYSSSTFKFYDGIIKSASGSGKSIIKFPDATPQGYGVVKTLTDGVESATLGASNYKNMDTGVEFVSLADAFVAAKDSQTIKMLNSFTETVQPVLRSPKTGIKLDLNGKTLTTTTQTGIGITGGLDIYSSSADATITGSGTNLLYDNGSLTINKTMNTYKVTLTTPVTNAYALYVAASKSAILYENAYITTTVEPDSGRNLIGVYGTLTFNGATLECTGEKNYGIKVDQESARLIINSGTINTVGHAIRNNNSTLTEEPAIEINGGNITTSGSNTIQNSNTGLIKINNGSITGSASSYPAISNASTGIIEINGGTITSASYGAYNVSTGVLNVNGGTITSSSYGVYNKVTGTVNITGGKITGTTAVYNVADGFINISGGTITASSASGVSNKGTATITGGTITGKTYGVYTDGNHTLTIGSDDNDVSDVSPVISTIGTSNNYGVYTFSTSIFSYYDGIVKSSSGTGYSIYRAPANIPNGFAVSKSTADGIETARLVGPRYKNMSTGTEYGTLNEAFSAVASNQTIKVLNSFTESTQASLASSKTGVKLDLNGKTIMTTTATGIQNNGSLEIYSSNGEGKIDGNGTSSTLYNNGTLTINATSTENRVVISKSAASGRAFTNNTNKTATLYENAYITATIEAESNRYIARNNGILYLEGATIESTLTNNAGLYIYDASARTIINSVTINTYGNCIYNASSTQTSPVAIEINDGEFTSTSARGVYNATTGTITINGGDFNTLSDGIYNYSTGVINFTGGDVLASDAQGIYNKDEGTINISGGRSEGQTGVYNKSSGTINVSSNADLYGTAAGIINEAGGPIYVTGGTISGLNGIYNYGTATVRISGSSTHISGGFNPAIHNVNSGTVIISDATIEGTRSYAVLNSLDGTVNINSGTLTSESSTAVYNKSDGTVNITTATISGTVGVINNSGGIVNISGGTISGTTYGAAINREEGIMTITGGTLSGPTYGVYNYDNGILTLGVNDSSVSTTSPYIEATEVGKNIGIRSTYGTVYFYDGIVKSVNGRGYSINVNPAAVPTNYELKREVVNGVESAYLVARSTLMKGSTGGVSSNFLRTNVEKQNIEKITFTNSISGHTVNGTDCFDVSYAEDGTVLAWVTDTNNNGKKEITIGANGKVYAFSGWRLFEYCKSLTEITGMQYFDTSIVTNMSYMFYHCESITSIDVTHFDTSNVTTMESMFEYSYQLSTLNLSEFNTSNVTTMESMFGECEALSQINVDSFDTSNVINIGGMFWYCKGLTSLNLSHFNTSNVEVMDNLFENCESLTSLNINSFDTSNVTSMDSMFKGCKILDTLDIRHFDTSNVTSMSQMFADLYDLSILDLRSFDTSNVTNMTQMFCRSTGLVTIIVSDKFVTTSVDSSASMFGNNTNLVGGAGTVFSNNNPKDKTYARVDTLSNPGYFTGVTGYIAVFHYNSNSILGEFTPRVVIAGCTPSQGQSSCLVVLPPVVSGSVGKYNSAYNGVSTTVGNMNSSSLTISADTQFYANYQTIITDYYYNSTDYATRNIYRNEFFTSASNMNSVLSTSATGTTSYTPSSGPNTSAFSGFSIDDNDSVEYSSVNDALVTSSSSLYELHKYDVTYAKGTYVEDIGSESGTCNITYGNTSCGVIVPSIIAMIGYEAVGWSATNGDTNGVAPMYLYMLTNDNLTLYANAVPSNTIYNVLARDYGDNNHYALMYSGEHKDSFTENPSKSIYYYYANTSSKASTILEKNNVKFAGKCWQMIRTTDTGGVKMIYNGEYDSTNQCGTNRSKHIGYKNREYGYEDESWYYGTDYTYNGSEFTLAGTISTGEIKVGQYTCGATTANAVCSTLYFVTSSTGLYNLTPIENNAHYSDLGSVYFNSTYTTIADIGYMYNSDYNLYSFGHTKTVLHTNTMRTEGVYYSSSYIYDSQNDRYALDNPILTTNANDLIGKYTLFSNNINITSTAIHYVTKVNNGKIYNIYIDDGETLSDANVTMSYGTSYTDNGNNTYTINNPISFELKDWLDYYSDAKYKYLCYDTTNNTCSDLVYVSSTSDSDYHYTYKSDTFKYSNSVTYSNGTYTLTGASLTTFEYANPDVMENMRNKHYTCKNTTGTCSEVYFVYGMGLNLHFLKLTGGLTIDQAIENMIRSNNTNTKDSIIKMSVEAWYKKYMLDYDSYIEDTIYCNDRTVIDYGGYDKDDGLYTDFVKFYNYNLNTNLKCNHVLDQFSVSNNSAKLNYKVGLITSPESRMMGVNAMRSTGHLYWTMSPYYVKADMSKNRMISTSGAFTGSDGYITSGLRPVISLKPGTTYISGTGSTTDPYVIDTLN